MRTRNVERFVAWRRNLRRSWRKSLESALDGDSVLVMSIPGGADLWAPGPIDQHHDMVKNPFGTDDTSFRLVRTDLKECEDLAFNRQKPLRAHEP